MKWALTFLGFLLPAIALADPFPALYDVTGVAHDDVLNVRAEPNASADKRTVFGPAETDIEVVRLSDDKRWGLVNSGDGAGWVSMRYMARHPGQDWGALPLNIFCSGTEPFWSFEVSEDGTAQFRAPDEAGDYAVYSRLQAMAYPSNFAVVSEGPDGRVTAIIGQRTCNDGMSDREYGMEVGLLFEDSQPRRLYRGCCSLQN